MELSDVQKEADSAGRKAWLFGIFALCIAGTMGFLMAKFGNSAPDTQPVVVAARALPPLTTLRASDLAVVNWPLSAVPEGTVRDPNVLLSPVKINVNELIKNEPVLLPRITNADSGLAVSTLIDPEKRAFVVQVEDWLAASQILHPGCTVDVVATLRDPRAQGTVVTKTLLQNVKVLAIGDRVDVEPQPMQFDDDTDEQRKQRAKDPRDRRERHRIVTLSVSLSDVELLSYAAREGHIDLTMRASSDSEIVATQGVTTEKLFPALKKVEGSGDDEERRAPPAGQGGAPRPRPRRRAPMIYRGHLNPGMP